MKIETLNCDEEQIHLCGKIQQFGYLIVFDLNLNCIAISENCIDWLPQNTQNALNQEIDFFQKHITFENKTIISLEIFREKTNYSTSYKVKLNNEDYQLTIYSAKDQIFLEFEKKSSDLIELNELNKLQKRFNNDVDIWQTLCEITYEVINFDRIMIYQFLEDNSGIVIAEHTQEGLESLKGYRYPDFDIPEQARNLYLKNLSRQTADTKAKTINIISNPNIEVDLTQSQIRALSPIHLQYLDNFGVRASASFSIIIDNKLWGLLACQNITPKYIPYDQRYLCLLLTQYATNSHYIKEQQANIFHNKIINELELELKEKLYNQSIDKTLTEFSSQLMQALDSTGFILKSNNHTFRRGETPNNNSFNKIHEIINNKIKTDSIFTSHCLLDEEISIDNHNWTGVARISFDKDHLHTMYLFRKEIVLEEKWAGIPEKYPIYSNEKKAYIYSPRTSFQVWIKEVKGQSEKWSKFDKTFLKRIHKQVQDSIIQKFAKNSQINEKLIEINNQLETYTHQLAHDLKNPLSVIKINAQFLKSHPEVDKTTATKFSTSIIESATLINEIMDKTLETTKSTPSVLTYELIQVDEMINQLIEQAVVRYNVKNFILDLKEIHPIFGEKTLLHQLFMNLINNAIKFSSKSESTYLNIYSTIDRENTTYYIKDNGIGIREDELTNIFSMFKRLSNAVLYEGTGVGMAIVKRIVDRLNAQISIDSQIGSGTTFKIKFPNEQR